MNESFSQLASVSAVLGGFAFAFLGALLSSDARHKPRFITAALVIPSAACFVLSALGWSLISVWMGSPFFDPDTPLPDNITGLHMLLSPIFLCGICFFFWSLAACGWVYSKRLGWLSSGIGLIATLLMIKILWPFLIAA
ncbi:hypothetical protein OPS25_00040 [Alteromonas ponticola]|uniref:Uncharacterized protein n=1 Tax=Alteromonas aquimaris TaxID=2998417 RepID=A0ABT3P294_9ALTE|nr:hypothetical protein [Alteromonas aquimaris]MCW8106889.1 hypothetical protein [Alteromonas aquimaris]